MLNLRSYTYAVSLMSFPTLCSLIFHKNLIWVNRRQYFFKFAKNKTLLSSKEICLNSLNHVSDMHLYKSYYGCWNFMISDDHV
jgi:hypothetical protein